MDTSDYQRALEAARRELDTVLRNRVELDKRAAELKKTIDGLSALVGNTDHSTGLMIPASSLLTDVGISDAIRAILRETPDRALSPVNLRDELVRRGVNMAEYASGLAVIHNTLARLERQGEIIKLTDTEGVPYAYAIKKAVTPQEKLIEARETFKAAHNKRLATK